MRDSNPQEGLADTSTASRAVVFAYFHQPGTERQPFQGAGVFVLLCGLLGRFGKEQSNAVISDRSVAPHSLYGGQNGVRGYLIAGFVEPSWDISRSHTRPNPQRACNPLTIRLPVKSR